MVCWRGARGGDAETPLFKTCWRLKCERSMTKFNAGGETVGRPVGELAKSEPSREEMFSNGEANTGSSCCNVTDFGEAWWDVEATPVPGHWSTKIDACEDKRGGLTLMRGVKTGTDGASAGDVGGVGEIEARNGDKREEHKGSARE